MALNGTDFVNEPWNTTFSPFTNLFENTVGNGNAFYLIPLVALTIGIYIKTRDTKVTSVFMIASGALLGGGSIFSGVPEMGVLFIIFAAIGLVGMISSIIFQR